MEKEMTANIRTTLRAKGGKPLRIQFYLKPLHDEQGNVFLDVGFE
jgi:hypothetical protein